MPRREREIDDKNDQPTYTAWVMNGGAGSINNLQQQQLPIVPPQPDQVTIEVRAIGLNFADLFAILGLYSATPQGSFIPGLEISGVVIQKGSDVPASIKIGTRVFGCTRFGGFTQRLNLDARYIRKLPDSWSFAEGAAFLAQSLTAFYGLVELGSLGRKKGQTVLVHSAAGGTGLFAVRLAQIYGCFPIGTVSSAEKVDALTKPISEGGVLKNPLPASAVITRSTCDSNLATVLKNSIANSYQSEPLMRSRKNHTLDLVFDSLLGNWFSAAWGILEPMGRHVVLGAAEMTPSTDSVFSSPLSLLKLAWQYLRRPMIDPLETISLNKSFIAFNLIWLFDRYDEMSLIMDEMLEVLGFENGGRFSDSKSKQNKTATSSNEEQKPVVGCVFKFDQIPEAIRHFQTGKTIGKVIIDV